jgi:negative regulator of flagellin synthesis FlgM
MKIDNKIVNYETNQHITKYAQNINEGRQVPDGQKNQEIKHGNKDAIVNISPASKELRTAVEAISSAPEVREDKIAEIRDKIESGRYRIDNQAVAGKVLDDFIDGIL